MTGPGYDDTLDLREVGGALVRGWWWLLLGLALGVTGALLANHLLPKEYEAVGTVVLRDRNESAGSPLGGGLGSGLAEAFSLPGSMGPSVDTEMEILESRQLAGQVVDSLGLQLRVRAPGGVAPDSLFSDFTLEPGLEGGQYRFRAGTDGYEVEGPGAPTSVQVGESFPIPGGTLTLRSAELPRNFTVDILDRQDAVSVFLSDLEVDRPGGDLGEITFRGPDPQTAAAGVNTLIDLYLTDRKGRTAALQEERLALLGGVADSVQMELERATGEFREFLEAQGTFDPERLDDVERAVLLRSEVDELAVEGRALDRILRRVEGDTLPVTDLLAFPPFIRTPAINDLLDRVLTFHTERLELLQRRTERDPEVMAMTESIRYLQGELVALAISYREGLLEQLEQLGTELDRYRESLAQRPAEEERTFILEQEFERLTATYLGVQAQVVQTRLTSIGDGADLRQIDPAEPPKEPAFPIPLLNWAVGILGGLLLGGIGAVSHSSLSDRIRDPRQIAAETGLPAIAYRPGHPILLEGTEAPTTLLLLPVGLADAQLACSKVAREVAGTETLRGSRVIVLDLTGPEAIKGMAFDPDALVSEDGPGGGRFRVYPGRGSDVRPGGVRAREVARELEDRTDLVVTALSSFHDPAAVALLKAGRPAVLLVKGGRTGMRELREASQALQRLGVRVAGVVLLPRGSRAHIRG